MSSRPPRPTLHRIDPRDPGRTRVLQRATQEGRFVRIRPGVYVRREDWDAIDEVGRHRTRADAVAPSLPDSASFSHRTAAALRGWAVLGELPERLDVADAGCSETRHRAGVLVRPARSPLARSTVTFAGVPVTSALDTAFDVAMTTPAESIAVTVGRAVRAGLVDRSGLSEALPTPPRRGAARARRVVDVLNRLHESPGEDLTALRLDDLGVTDVRPQHTFRGDDGFIARVDFWLPDLGVVVEFDGRAKYTDPAMLRGRDPGDVVWREKLREDALRGVDAVRTVIRPCWRDVMALDRFRALFRRHGLLSPR